MKVREMRAFNVVRAAGLAACAATSLLLVTATPAFASSLAQIDPFAQQATLTASDEIGASRIGSAVALSSNGNTALVGGPEDKEGTGAAGGFSGGGQGGLSRRRSFGPGRLAG